MPGLQVQDLPEVGPGRLVAHVEAVVPPALQQVGHHAGGEVVGKGVSLLSGHGEGLLSQVTASPVEPLLDARRCRSEMARHRLQRLSVDVVELEGGGGFRGQAVQQAGGRSGWVAFRPAVILQILCVVDVGLGPAAAVAQHVETSIPYRRPQPGPDPDRFAQLVEASQRSDQGLLHRVQGLVGRPQVSQGVPVELVLMALDEDLEGGQVPGRRGTSQGIVACTHGVHACRDT